MSKFFEDVLPDAVYWTIYYTGLAVLGFFIGKGLWNGQKWTRIVAIIFAFLGILSILLLVVRDFVVQDYSRYIFAKIIGLIINLGIAGYLLFSKDVKSSFK